MNKGKKELKKLLKKIKKMSIQEYIKLYEECQEKELLHIAFYKDK